MSTIADNLYDCIFECEHCFTKLPDFSTSSIKLHQLIDNQNLITISALLLRIDELFCKDIIHNKNLNSISIDAQEVLEHLQNINNNFNVNNGILSLIGKRKLDKNDHERTYILDNSYPQLHTIRTRLWKLVDILKKKPEVLHELITTN